MKNNRCKKGFTLIELLVVVLIIGILAAIALPQYQKAVEKSRAVEMITFVGNAKKAVELYLLENGGFPTGDDVDFLRGGLSNIDLTTGLTCPDDRDCYNKFFLYRVFCDSNRCGIDVTGAHNGNWDALHSSMTMLTLDGKTWTVQDAVYQAGDKSGQASCEAFVQAFGGTCQAEEMNGD